MCSGVLLFLSQKSEKEVGFGTFGATWKNFQFKLDKMLKFTQNSYDYTILSEYS